MTDDYWLPSDHDWPLEHYMTRWERLAYGGLWWLHTLTHEDTKLIAGWINALEVRAWKRLD